MAQLAKAPVFYPSEQEFLSLEDFLRSKRREVLPFGMCRVVPPASWAPAFRHSPSTTFTTRTQDLGQLKHLDEMNKVFIEKLKRFRNARRSCKEEISDYNSVRLQELYRTVQRRGGKEKVCWEGVAEELNGYGMGGKEMKKVYERYIGDYVEECENVKRVKRKANTSVKENHHLSVKCESCKGSAFTKHFNTCSECHQSIHSFCMSPPQTKHFERYDEKWVCKFCRVENDEFYGYGEGNEYSISSFGEYADSIFQSVFPDTNPTDDEIAAKYWETVDKGQKLVVEYGNDLETLKYKSGFLESDAKHWNSSWNVFRLPESSGSLLRYLSGSLSGVNRPWLYIGMLFSTFAWHCEDHHLYSINYTHFGSPKRWYAVPPSDLLHFRRVFAETFPELLQSQPDILFQLVTMLSPQFLLEQGVRVCTTVQHAREFVVTFPGTYHAGFNQGFNGAEAVNFALDDWVPYGVLCAETYVENRLRQVFSYERVLFRVIDEEEEDMSGERACWLLGGLEYVSDKERNTRRRVYARYPGTRFRQVEEWKPLLQCNVCLNLLYSSFITCSNCPGRQVCLEHCALLCECPTLFSHSRKTVSYRLSLAELQQYLERTRLIASRCMQHNSIRDECAAVVPSRYKECLESASVFWERAWAWKRRAGVHLCRAREMRREAEKMEVRRTRSKGDGSEELATLLVQSKEFVWEDYRVDSIRELVSMLEDYID